jgi:uncharacterized protein YktB (UPF0637 family)
MTFEIEGFNQRMEQLYALVRPRLMRLGDELAPELARKLRLEFFPHVARHARRTVNPPPETWAAFGPSPRGYKHYGYLALCISRAGVHARAVVKPEAQHRPAMAGGLRRRAGELTRSLSGIRISRYDRWDFGKLPPAVAADEQFFAELGANLERKIGGGIDIGFGWPRSEALRLDRAELLDAFRELEPIYRVLRDAT